MKQFYLVLFCCSVFFSVRAQSVPTRAKYADAQQPALLLNVPFKDEVAEGTIIQKLKESGNDPETKGILFWKKNTINGYYKFEGVKLPELQSNVLDLYFKIDQKSKRGSGSSDIYMLVSKGYNNFISAETDPELYAAAQRFLNSFTTETAEFKMSLEMSDLEKKIKEAENKVQNLQEDKKSFERKAEKAQGEIEEQNRLVNELKNKLAELKGRKSATGGN
jgi:hypothetical protein